jgi:hypothetical protein
MDVDDQQATYSYPDVDRFLCQDRIPSSDVSHHARGAGSSAKILSQISFLPCLQIVNKSTSPRDKQVFVLILKGNWQCKGIFLTVENALRNFRFRCFSYRVSLLRSCVWSYLRQMKPITCNNSVGCIDKDYDSSTLYTPTIRLILRCKITGHSIESNSLT